MLSVPVKAMLCVDLCIPACEWCVCVYVRVCICREYIHSLAIGTTCKWEQQATAREGEIQAPPRTSANFGSLLQQCKQTVTPWFSVKRQKPVYTCSRPQNFSSYSIFSNYTTVNFKVRPFLFVDLFYTFYVQQL